MATQQHHTLLLPSMLDTPCTAALLQGLHTAHHATAAQSLCTYAPNSTPTCIAACICRPVIFFRNFCGNAGVDQWHTQGRHSTPTHAAPTV